MFNRFQLRQVFRQLFVICGVILLSRFTKNWGLVFLSLYGVGCCLERKIDRALVVFLLLSFLPMVNPFIMPRYGQFAMIARISSLLMSLSLLASGVTQTGSHRLPLDILFVYLLVAAFSSLQGYAPLVSELKIINFAFFLIAFLVGTRNLHKHQDGIQLLRSTFMALIAFIGYGSFLTLPFPHIAYLTSVRNTLITQGMDAARDIVSQGKTLLFCGVANQSQFLGPMAASSLAWLLCDMCLVERRWNPLHVVLLLPLPAIALMTRSRIALVTLVVAFFSSVCICLPRTKLSRRVKTRFYGVLFLILIVSLSIAIVSQYRKKSISRWLRKTDDVTTDDRSLGDAMTQSRQGAIAENMRDFRRNRLLGSGFQVSQAMQYRLNTSSLFSAPIEKGILPLMILGEGGLVGAGIFIIFLTTFFSTCHAKRYSATMALFIVFLATNMAEATFFSPAGAGGVFWSLLILGGFTIDMAVVADSPPPPATLGFPFEYPIASSEEDDDEQSELFELPINLIATPDADV